MKPTATDYAYLATIACISLAIVWITVVCHITFSDFQTQIHSLQTAVAVTAGTPTP